MIGSHAWKSGDEGTTVSRVIHDLTNPSGVSIQHEEPLQTLLASSVVKETKTASLNTKRDGPFAKGVQKSYPNEDFHGGKVDDICVIVAIVVQNE